MSFIFKLTLGLGVYVCVPLIVAFIILFIIIITYEIVIKFIARTCLMKALCVYLKIYHAL